MLVVVSSTASGSLRFADGFFALILETAPVASRLPTRMFPKTDEFTIKDSLKKALAQHKEDADADPVRESEERMKQKIDVVENELAATRGKIDAVETKIDELTRMIQYYLRKQQSLAGDSSPDTPL